MFGRLKDWRRIATRYDRCPKVFLSAVALAATVLFWYQRVWSIGLRQRLFAILSCLARFLLNGDAGLGHIAPCALDRIAGRKCKAG